LEKPYEQNNSRKSSSREFCSRDCVKYIKSNFYPSKSADATPKAASTTTKTTRPRSTSRSTKSTASSTSTKVAPAKTTKPSVQQDKTMSQNTVRRVAIIGGNRIPFARSNGAYFTASNMDMFTAALNGLLSVLTYKVNV
jgi:acetyl-CoA C-acetyltransferase